MPSQDAPPGGGAAEPSKKMQRYLRRAKRGRSYNRELSRVYDLPRRGSASPISNFKFLISDLRCPVLPISDSPPHFKVGHFPPASPPPRPALQSRPASPA